jgi:hypothetical protein
MNHECPAASVHTQTAQSKAKFCLPSFGQLVQSVFGELKYLVIVSQLMTLEDPAELICTV